MAIDIHNVKFPKGQIKLDDKGKAYLEFNSNYENDFNNDLNKTQAFFDEAVAKELSKYVSFRSGTQSLSIIIASDFGSGIVTIGVPYAKFQYYGKVMVGEQSHSPWARKGERKITTGKDLKYHSGGIRGRYPFERMKANKKASLLKQVAAYSRRLNNG